MNKQATLAQATREEAKNIYTQFIEKRRAAYFFVFLMLLAPRDAPGTYFSSQLHVSPIEKDNNTQHIQILALLQRLSAQDSEQTGSLKCGWLALGSGH